MSPKTFNNFYILSQLIIILNIVIINWLSINERAKSSIYYFCFLYLLSFFSSLIIFENIILDWNKFILLILRSS